MANSGFLLRKGLLLAGIMMMLFVADVALGSTPIPILKVIHALLGGQDDATVMDIIWQFRLPKAVTCLLAGAALSVGGLMMQSLFRNPLAGPDVLGLSAGSSLMVALLLMTGTSSTFAKSLSGPWSQVIAAALGGMVIFFLVISIAGYLKDNTALLIVGLMLSALTSSVVSVLQFISKAEDLQSYVMWSMGSVGSANWTEIKVLAIFVALGLSIAFILIKSLNGWLLGENYARSVGIPISRSRFWIVVSTSLLTGSVTAFCGPVAFIGLAVPHLVRLVIPTTNHKILIPAVMMGGSSSILFCDILTQLPGTQQLLPLNAITSLIGAPVVIWMILKYKQIKV